MILVYVGLLYENPVTGLLIHLRNSRRGIWKYKFYEQQEALHDSAVSEIDIRTVSTFSL
jgi:hypothetical protein